MSTGGDVEVGIPLQQGSGRNAETEKERRDQIRHLEKEAFQLANYYFVFQGVIFTAFYHAPSRVKCRYKWVPLTLSVLAGILNACALLRIALGYKRTLDESDRGSTGGGDSIAAACARCWRCFYVVACMLVVLAFLAVTLAGCWLITCGGAA